MMFVDQIHLKVARFSTATQIVLPYQPVEIDRAGRTGIRLPVMNFLNAVQVFADFTQHLCGFFNRGADRHVEDDLKFALVVERQHFQHHQLHQCQRY